MLTLIPAFAIIIPYFVFDFRLEEARRNKRTLSSSRDAYDDRKRVAAESRRYEAEHVSSHR